MSERLIDLLTHYQEGDLVATADLVEEATAVAVSPDSEGAPRDTANEIAERFRAIARMQASNPTPDEVERWVAALAAEPQARGPLEQDDGTLSFLGRAVGHLSAIVDMLKRYRDGDLALATEILAETQLLATDPNTPGDALPIIRGIRDTFFDHVRAAVGEPQATEPPDAEPSRDKLPAERPAAAHEVAIDDLDVVTSFIQESADHLDDIEHRVLKLEDEHSDELVNSIFRSMHTIKGVASFVGFSHVSETSHELEALLDEVRNGRQQITDEVITVLLDGTDVLSRIVGSIEQQVAGGNGSGAPSVVTEESFDHLRIVERVQALRLGRPVGAQAPAPAESTDEPANQPTQGSTMTEEEAAAAIAASDPVTPEMIDAFIEESTDLLDGVEQELLRAESEPIDPETVGRVFRAVHTVKGNAGFFWFTRVEQQCMALEEELDGYRTRGASIDHDAAGRFLDMVDMIRGSIRAVAGAAGTVTSESPETVDRTGESGDGDGLSDGDALGKILVQMGEISEESLERALSRQQRRLGEILVSEEDVKPDSVEKALAEQAKRRTTGGTANEYAVSRKDIRVDTVKLDKLFDLVGELITAESMLLGGIESSENGGATLTKAASYLQKITREMQEITLSVRMIPLEATFGKMRRLVRDLARRFEKDVTIEISGEQTEMDKNVIEEVSDPLVHIIRNAIDHGIESATDREAAGKPRTGTIRLSAKHEGNEIWITIADDGRGLDRDRILAKAIERGLVGEQDGELTDDQIYRFIFEPAFSTAGSVSEISGRGVGMDVVRQNTEKLRGKIDLSSEPGQGTTFILRIPLTLAILDGVTFEIGDTQFSVPTTDLVTFQSYSEESITGTGSGHHGFRLRDEVIPIIQYEHRDEIPDHGVIIVLQSADRTAALVVDRIVGYRQFVVRAMPAYIGRMRAVSGCSIQGDGSISFILDVGQLIAEEIAYVGAR